MAHTPKRTPGVIVDLDKFIHGVVHKFIKSAHLDKFILENKGSDDRDDMVQIAHMKVVELLKKHPKRAKKAAYLKACIINSLINYAHRDGRTQRELTDNTIDEPSVINPPSPTKPFDIMEAQIDLGTLMAKAELTDAEELVLELKYGFRRGADYGECTTRQSAAIMSKSQGWVQDRLTSAMIKCQVAVE